MWRFSTARNIVAYACIWRTLCRWDIRGAYEPQTLTCQREASGWCVGSALADIFALEEATTWLSATSTNGTAPADTAGVLIPPPAEVAVAGVETLR